MRIVTNDFMLTGGDGYTALAGGTNVAQPGDGLLEISVDYIGANSPLNVPVPCTPTTACRITRG